MTAEIRHIVVATDFSPSADLAVRRAAALALRHDAELTLVHAHGLSAAHANAAEEALGAEPFRRELQASLAAAEERLAHRSEELRQAGVRTTERIVDVPVAQHVCDVAAELSADLLVVGSRGLNKLKRLLVGSDAMRIVRGADTSVLVVRGQAPDAGYGKLLIPVDLEQSSEEQIALAAAISAPDAEGVVLHCSVAPSTLQGSFVRDDAVVHQLVDNLHERSRAAVEALVAAAPAKPALSAALVSGSPALAIEMYSEDHGPFDLVAVGSGDRGRFSRLLLGSVAEDVVKRSPASVLVVRTSEIADHADD